MHHHWKPRLAPTLPTALICVVALTVNLSNWVIPSILSRATSKAWILPVQRLSGRASRGGSKRFIFERHNDRNALEYRSGRDYREDLIFYNYHTVLPFADLTDGYPPESWSEADKIPVHTTFADHPGKWECQWLDNGELMRTFRWEVDGNGQLVPHPEQNKGLTLNPGAILVETIIPEGGAAFDGRLVPKAVQAGGFYGWKWKSSEMKKLAKQVPEIGNPWPVPSAPEFVPEPDKGPSAQEIAKAKREAEAEAKAEQRKAEQAARDTKLKQEREDYAAAEQARLAENEKTRQEAYEKELARTQAMVADQLEEANGNAADAMRKARRSAVNNSPYAFNPAHCPGFGADCRGADSGQR